jgi:hypothetical protein
MLVVRASFGGIAMASKTTTRVMDRRGVRLVVGQHVTIESGQRGGQLMGFADSGACLVRITSSSEVVSLAASELSVSSWEQVRKEDKTLSDENRKLF